MNYIDREYYKSRALNGFKDKDKIQSQDKNIEPDIDKILCETGKKVKDFSIQDVATWLLDKDTWLDFEDNGNQPYPQLGKGRVINVNPGIDNIGREQRYVHMHIVLAEYKETFIGVPITNAKIEKNKPVLRNELEVLLKDPKYKKPFKEFRCPKPSVVDLRNIRGFDKKRIVEDKLYSSGRSIPNTYKRNIEQAILRLFTFSCQADLALYIAKDLINENLQLKEDIKNLKEKQ